MAVGPLGTLRPECPAHAVTDLADEPSLRHRHNAEVRRALHLIRPGDAEVLDPMPGREVARAPAQPIRG